MKAPKLIGAAEISFPFEKFLYINYYMGFNNGVNTVFFCCAPPHGSHQKRASSFDF